MKESVNSYVFHHCVTIPTIRKGGPRNNTKTYSTVDDAENHLSPQHFCLPHTLFNRSFLVAVILLELGFGSIPNSCKVGSFLIRSKGELRVALMATSLDTSSTYSGILSSSSPCFVRPSGSGTVYYYQAIQVTVFAWGMHTFSSSSLMDTFSCLYNETFFPDRSSQNLIESDDDSNGAHQFRIRLNLQPGRAYILVVTTFSEIVTGSFQITATGPMQPVLSSAQPITKCSSTNDSDERTDQLHGNFGSIGLIKRTTASYVLSSSSPEFARPYAYDYNNVPYQAILVTVSMTGMYTFKSSSSIDTSGYLYNEPFNSSDSYRNLIISDDDSGGNLQFQINASLQSSHSYVLVVTPYRKAVTGRFLIEAAGPERLELTTYRHSAGPYSCGNKLTCKAGGLLKIIKSMVISAGCVGLLIGVFCCRPCTNKRKRTLRQQLSLLRQNPISQANSIPLRNVSINTGRTNEIDRPYTISISTVAATYAEQPPPTYEAAVLSSQR
ncbi:unnamed protein product [Rotaria socialis]|uniref:Uncharacterized protein n=1 Tax=Rotaria socialis TaxID=392032 RepID=A0A820WAM6_9BILA|nr:unnamed protein product [Rotaria socialis]